MDPLNPTLTRTTSRPATDHPINHTPRPSIPPMTKDPFLLQTIPNPPSPTKSRIADIFHRRRQASRQQQTYPHPPTSMPAPLAATDDNNIEMRTLPHNDRAKKTDSTSTSMGTPKSPYPPGAAAPLPVAAPPTTTTSKNTNTNKGAHHRSDPVAGRTTNKAGGLLLEGVRYSLPGGEPVGWFEMFEKTRKFEGGFVETLEGGVRCIHPSAWGEDELGEYGPGGGGEQGHGQVVRSPGGMGGRGKGGGGRVSNVGGGGGRGIGDGDGEGASGAIMERADSETLGEGRFGGEGVVPVETLGDARFGESIVPTTSRSAALRSGLIGLEDDDGEDGDDEGEGGPSSGRSHEMDIMFVLDEGPKPGMVIGGGRVV